jgi:hypothetical protein
MTAEEWRVCADPDAMLVAVNGVATDRQLRLWCCACVRRVWRRLARAKAGRRAVEVAEAFARGAASASDLAEACRGAEEALRQVRVSRAKDALRASAWCAAGAIDALGVARSVAWGATYAAVGQEDAAGVAVERAVQAELLRALVGDGPE